MKFVFSLFSVLIISIISTPAVGQFQVGQTTITFNDPDRTGGFGSGGGPGRQIQTEIYYPASTAGTNVAVAGGTFPIISFGHGFVMTWSAYQNIWEFLVPQGYIVAFPRTEGGFSPSHLDFGLDLALVVERMEALNDEQSSLFFGHVAQNAAAIMGHSMGGGATMLGAATINVQAVIGLASAETSTSAIAAAADVTAPMLMLSGSSDDVTPPAEHQIPIFNASAALCKYHVTITGGGHCNFANSNFNCNTGELFTSGNITISRAEQQATMNDYVLPWLNRWLKDDVASLQDFTDLLWTDNRVTFVENCIATSVPEFEKEVSVFPNPASDVLNVELDESLMGAQLFLLDAVGRMVKEEAVLSTHTIFNVGGMPSGVYHLIIRKNDEEVIKVRWIKTN
ncbi:MAG: T9SS C-terminal target domain-containing protein [Cryomorphaceae bacterium]|nr:MAG: T9SS C-terminal target domain-containing protein [Cryomorphaceae bacterium]